MKRFKLPIWKIYVVIARYLVKKIQRTSVTPNQITTIGSSLGIISSVFFSLGTHPYLIIGSILLQLSMVLDAVDGQLARAKKMTSHYGTWLSVIGDKLCDAFVLFGICWGVYYVTGNVLTWIIGFVAVVSRYLILCFRIYYTVIFPSGNKIIKEGLEKRRILSYIAYSRSNIHFLILVFSLLNQMFLCLLLLSIYGCAFLFVSLIFLTNSVRVSRATRKN